MKPWDKKYFEAYAEVDYIHWLLTKMLKEEKSLLPIEKMIEESTAYEKVKLAEARKLIKRAEYLKAKIKKAHE